MRRAARRRAPATASWARKAAAAKAPTPPIPGSSIRSTAPRISCTAFRISRSRSGSSARARSWPAWSTIRSTTSFSPPSAAKARFSTANGCGWRRASGSATRWWPAGCPIWDAATSRWRNRELAARAAQGGRAAPIRGRLARSGLGGGRAFRRLLGAPALAVGYRGGADPGARGRRLRHRPRCGAIRPGSAGDVVAGNETMHRDLLACSTRRRNLRRDGFRSPPKTLVRPARRRAAGTANWRIAGPKFPGTTIIFAASPAFSVRIAYVIVCRCHSMCRP